MYIIPLLERLNLPKSHYAPSNGPKLSADGMEKGDPIRLFAQENLSAKANPKSSTGRLDVFTRVITDYSHRFEEITPGYQGPLYVEVVPKSFPIKVKTGQRLNQLRIRHGFEVLSDQDLLRIHDQEPILFDDTGSPMPIETLKVNKGLFMSVHLKGKEGQIIGYKAKKTQ